MPVLEKQKQTTNTQQQQQKPPSRFVISGWSLLHNKFFWYLRGHPQIHQRYPQTFCSFVKKGNVTNPGHTQRKNNSWTWLTHAALGLLLFLKKKENFQTRAVIENQCDLAWLRRTNLNMITGFARRNPGTTCKYVGEITANQTVGLPSAIIGCFSLPVLWMKWGDVFSKARKQERAECK